MIIDFSKIVLMNCYRIGEGDENREVEDCEESEKEEDEYEEEEHEVSSEED